eukprot:PLAT12473.13.p1 GENE.PLAT12473.13~~PLAT12473.13.p1  ORF type:complete len:544 (+),score=262.59 PLAT12473.13:184-1815(+)
MPKRSRKPRPLPAFLSKTYAMVNAEETNTFIRWAADGLTFEVRRQKEFAQHILPRYFKHSNFTSFVRQLNFYGFHKLAFEDKDKSVWRFSHDHFRRERADLLTQIKRKTYNSSSSPSSSTSSSTSSRSAAAASAAAAAAAATPPSRPARSTRTAALPVPQTRYGGLALPAPSSSLTATRSSTRASGAGSEVTLLRAEVDMLRNEVSDMKTQLAQALNALSQQQKQLSEQSRQLAAFSSTATTDVDLGAPLSKKRKRTASAAGAAAAIEASVASSSSAFGDAISLDMFDELQLPELLDSAALSSSSAAAAAVDLDEDLVEWLDDWDLYSDLPAEAPASVAPATGVLKMNVVKSEPSSLSSSDSEVEDWHTPPMSPAPTSLSSALASSSLMTPSMSPQSRAALSPPASPLHSSMLPAAASASQLASSSSASFAAVAAAKAVGSMAAGAAGDLCTLPVEVRGELMSSLKSPHGGARVAAAAAAAAAASSGKSSPDGAQLTPAVTSQLLTYLLPHIQMALLSQLRQCPPSRPKHAPSAMPAVGPLVA